MSKNIYIKLHLIYIIYNIYLELNNSICRNCLLAALRLDQSHLWRPDPVSNLVPFPLTPSLSASPEHLLVDIKLAVEKRVDEVVDDEIAVVYVH